MRILNCWLLILSIGISSSVISRPSHANESNRINLGGQRLPTIDATSQIELLPAGDEELIKACHEALETCRENSAHQEELIEGQKEAIDKLTEQIGELEDSQPSALSYVLVTIGGILIGGLIAK